LLAVLNASGALYLTHTRLHDRYVLRLAVGGPYTKERHVADAWRHIQEQADAVG
jgi:aromatic-L-amino-acid decarboxylase